MVRPAAKHLVALAVVAILGIGLVADYLWASSFSASYASSAALTPPVAKKVKHPISHSQCLGMRDCCLSPAAEAQALLLRGRVGERSTDVRTGLEGSDGNQRGIGNVCVLII
jgi:curli biogenesis system outer membrane secretion channel CsgG|uniref:Uncharacterized protein n=1 Tax=Zea mays TaxID=4577 RepID=A0A804UMN9_MAIZE